MEIEEIKSIYEKAYALLEDVTPFEYDCGQLCGAACCGVSDDGIVSTEEESDFIYLLPGEECMHDRGYDTFTWTEVISDGESYPYTRKGTTCYILRCKGPANCRRDKRPMQCRTYPLWPYIDADGRVEVIYSPVETEYICPIIENEPEIDERFYNALLAAWQLLIQIPDVRHMVEVMSREIDAAYED